MTQHSVQPSDWVFVKCYGSLSFAKIWAQILVKI